MRVGGRRRVGGGRRGRIGGRGLGRELSLVLGEQACLLLFGRFAFGRGGRLRGGLARDCRAGLRLAAPDGRGVVVDGERAARGLEYGGEVSLDVAPLLARVADVAHRRPHVERAASLAAVEHVVAAQETLGRVLRVEFLQVAVAELALLVLLVAHGLPRREALRHARLRLLLLGRRLLGDRLTRWVRFARHGFKVRIPSLLGLLKKCGKKLDCILRARREERQPRRNDECGMRNDELKAGVGF